MTKARYNLNTFTLTELKSQIAIKLCFPISGKSDCEKFSEILLNEGYGSVSTTTLYRLFLNYDGQGASVTGSPLETNSSSPTQGV